MGGTRRHHAARGPPPPTERARSGDARVLLTPSPCARLFLPRINRPETVCAGRKTRGGARCHSPTRPAHSPGPSEKVRGRSVDCTASPRGGPRPRFPVLGLLLAGRHIRSGWLATPSRQAGPPPTCRVLGYPPELRSAGRRGLWRGWNGAVPVAGWRASGRTESSSASGVLGAASGFFLVGARAKQPLATPSSLAENLNSLVPAKVE